MSAISDDHDACRPARRLAHPFFIGQTDQHRQLHRAGQIAQYQIGFVFSRQAASKLERFIGIEGPGEQADHHPLLGLGGMPRNRQRMRAVMTSIEIGNREVGLVDRGAQCHEDSVVSATA